MTDELPRTGGVSVGSVLFERSVLSFDAVPARFTPYVGENGFGRSTSSGSPVASWTPIWAPVGVGANACAGIPGAGTRAGLAMAYSVLVLAEP